MAQSKEVHKEYMRRRREGSQQGSQTEGSQNWVHSDVYLKLCPVPAKTLQPTGEVVHLCGEPFNQLEWIPV